MHANLGPCLPSTESVLEDGTWDIAWGVLSLVPEHQGQRPQQALKSLAECKPGQGCKNTFVSRGASSCQLCKAQLMDVRGDYVLFLPFISFPGLQPNSSVLFRTFQKALHKVKTSGLHLNSKIKLLFMSPGHLQRQRRDASCHADLCHAAVAGLGMGSTEPCSRATCFMAAHAQPHTQPLALGTQDSGSVAPEGHPEVSTAPHTVEIV